MRHQRATSGGPRFSGAAAALGAVVCSLGIALAGCAENPQGGDPPAAGRPSPEPSSPAPVASAIAETAWGYRDTPGRPFFTFHADGDAGGNDGCNVIGGTWHAEGDTIVIEDMVTTLMYCDGVDPWLASAHTAVVEGESITFSDEEGEVIGSLSQADYVDP